MCSDVGACETEDVDPNGAYGASEVDEDFTWLYLGEIDAVERGVDLPFVGVARVGAEPSDGIGIVIDWIELVFPVVVLGYCFVFDFRLLVPKVDGYCVGQVEVGTVVVDDPGAMSEYNVACSDFPCLSFTLSNIGVFIALHDE